MKTLKCEAKDGCRRKVRYTVRFAASQPPLRQQPARTYVACYEHAASAKFAGATLQKF